ncbi:fluoride efflux transporter CrcB [Piscinibacter sakaiensis]|uniref:fluoride efflux transporter CrcB n=1 Tax=Piscinibacter sakaiensis TaxID=1547922 RepID=UPI003AAA5140
MAGLGSGSTAAAQLLAVAIGAVLGAVLRWRLSLWLNGAWHGFPLGTLLVNCAGGLLIGLAMVWFVRNPNESMRLLVVTGLLGSLTTFSTFSAESLALLQRGHLALASLHTLVHVLGSLGSAAIGFAIGRHVWH